MTFYLAFILYGTPCGEYIQVHQMKSVPSDLRKHVSPAVIKSRIRHEGRKPAGL